MNAADHRYLVHLINSALALVARHTHQPAAARRQMRVLAREVILLRARFGQPTAASRRN